MVLGLELGKTLSEIENMPREEFVSWMAFYEIYPFGCAAEDHRAAMLLDMTYLVHAKKGSKPPKWFDRDPYEKADPSPEELAERVRDVFGGFKVVRVPAKKERKPRKDRGVKRGPKPPSDPAK